jgi:hypothetical protein
MASGSLNVQSSEYAMILPAVVFKMNGQSDGDSLEDFGSNAPPDERPTPAKDDDEPPDDEPPDDEPPGDGGDGGDGGNNNGDYFGGDTFFD